METGTGVGIVANAAAPDLLVLVLEELDLYRIKTCQEALVSRSLLSGWMIRGIE